MHLDPQDILEGMHSDAKANFCIRSKCDW